MTDKRMEEACSALMLGATDIDFIRYRKLISASSVTMFAWGKFI